MGGHGGIGSRKICRYLLFLHGLLSKVGWLAWPGGMNWVNLAGICLLGGIGFTVSLFIANLSFEASPVLLSQVKLGVFERYGDSRDVGLYCFTFYTTEKNIVLKWKNTKTTQLQAGQYDSKTAALVYFGSNLDTSLHFFQQSLYR